MRVRKSDYVLRFYVSAGLALFLCFCFFIDELPRFSKLLLIIALIIDGTVLVVSAERLDRM